MGGSNKGKEESEEDPLAAVPDWDDEYVDRVSDRLLHSYDLQQDRTVQGRRFTLYGQLSIRRHKQFLHPSVTYGDHQRTKHLLVQRLDDVSVTDMERLSALSETLAEEWIDPDVGQFGTDFVFGVVVPEIPADIRQFVSSFESRTLLRYGYHGHYTTRLFAVAPDREASVASPNTDIVQAFRLWDDGERERSQGVLQRLRAVFSRRR